MTPALMVPGADWPATVHPRPPLHPLPLILVAVAALGAVAGAIYQAVCGLPDALRCYPT